MAEEAEYKAIMEALGGELIVGPRVRGIRVAGWRIQSTKRSILNAEEIDRWQERLNTRHLPEMVFGDNSLELQHEASGVVLHFNAFDALVDWKRENLPPVEVPAAAKWKSRCKPNEQLILDYDYTYTTPYSGSQKAEVNGTSLEWKSCENNIDIVRLQAKEPILFYDEVILYEDELADNGISFLSVKVRVMPGYWFLLLRFWLRVDGVLMRLRDTRMFCAFQSDPRQLPVVIRERCQREDTFHALASRGYPFEASLYQDPNLVYEKLQVREQHQEELHVHVYKQIELPA